ncbi:MAG: hypothetical protein WCK89_22480 [bacterium]
MKRIIAIDPGGSGGVAWIGEHGAAACQKMPATRGDVIDLLKMIINYEPGKCVCYHEAISGFIPSAGPSMMFEFGRSCERTECIIEVLGVRMIRVTPQAWQKALGLGGSNRVKMPKKCEATPEEIKKAKSHNAEAKKDWKNKLKGEAQRRFPSADVTLDTADALLILDYALAKEGGK